MIVLILAVMLVGLAGLKRILHMKKNKNYLNVRIFIGALMICLLFFIAYFITDTTKGTFLTFTSIGVFVLIGTGNFRKNTKWAKYLFYIIGLPLAVYLLIKSIPNILISPSYLFILLTILNFILAYPNESKGNIKTNIALAIGIVGAVGIMFGYYKLSGSDNRIMIRQEIVAQNYLEELNIYGFDVYVRSPGSLRGRPVIVKGYHPLSTDTIEMVYQNGKIVEDSID